MQPIRLNVDESLGARLRAFQALFAGAESGAVQAPRVRMRAGVSMSADLRAGYGLRAAGMLLAYALLGEETEDAEACVRDLALTASDRPLRRVCAVACAMLSEDAAFTAAELYSALRGALNFLPETAAAAALPGLLLEGKQAQPLLNTTVKARYAFAEDAAIAYIELPENVDAAWVCGKEYTRAQCLAGVCLAPGVNSCCVAWDDGSAQLTVQCPARGLRFCVGFRLGRVFIPAAHMPRALYKRMTPCLRVTGQPGVRTPQMRVVSSLGETRVGANTLAGKSLMFPCPPLDAQADEYVSIWLPDLLTVDLRGES